MTRDQPILLTGATGHVGSRLLRELEEEGRPVRAGARSPDALDDVAPTTEVVRLDVLDEETVREAMRGATAAYYLVHSLGGGSSFAEDERRAAEIFGTCARDAGVERIVYLGGLAADDEDLSDHMASRHEVGEILRSSGVKTIELRASIVIGAGSLSFEMIRFFVDPLPVVTLPEWVKTFAQPIAIDDVVAYLVAALDVPLDDSRVFDIGGADRVPYLDVMEEYARQAGLKRSFVTLPLPAPFVTSGDLPDWLTGFAPDRVRAAAKLVESLQHETLVGGDEAREVFDIEPVGVEEAVRRALAEAA